MPEDTGSLQISVSVSLTHVAYHRRLKLTNNPDMSTVLNIVPYAHQG